MLSKLGNLAPLCPRYRKLLASGALIGLLVLPIGTALRAEEGDRGKRGEDHGQTKGEAGADRALRLKTLAPIPASKANNTAGAMYSFDISFVDPKTQTYYLADRSNAVVDVVDAKTGKFVKQISATPTFGGCTGTPATSGPHGVVAAHPWLFVTDAKGRVVTIDL